MQIALTCNSPWPREGDGVLRFHGWHLPPESLTGLNGHLHPVPSMGVSPRTLQRSVSHRTPNPKTPAASALGCPTVGWRLNRANTTLQRAIGSPGHSISRETGDENCVTLESRRPSPDWGGNTTCPSVRKSIGQSLGWRASKLPWSSKQDGIYSNTCTVTLLAACDKFMQCTVQYMTVGTYRWRMSGTFLEVPLNSPQSNMSVDFFPAIIYTVFRCFCQGRGPDSLCIPHDLAISRLNILDNNPSPRIMIIH